MAGPFSDSDLSELCNHIIKVFFPFITKLVILQQSIWRKIQEIGWAAKYQDEAEDGFRLHLTMFAALTFADTGFLFFT
uniref:Anoctamin n=1 Tax=Meloidogyne hapla TaxID=6305 RepID=A0A1I8BEF7_MELHA